MPDKAKVRDLLRSDGAQDERRARLHERFRWFAGVVLLILASWAVFLALRNDQRIDAQEIANAAAAEIAEQRDADIDAAFAEQDKKAQENAQAIADFLDEQAAAGVPVTADDVQAAIAAMGDIDPTIKLALQDMSNRLKALEQTAPPPAPPAAETTIISPSPYPSPVPAPPPPPPSPGPPGPPGTGVPGPPGDPGVGTPGKDGKDGVDGTNGVDGKDGETPQVAAALMGDGHLVLSVTTSAGTEYYDVGSVVGPPGPQGDQGPQGDPGSVTPGTYQCGSGYMTGLTVNADGSVTPICATLPIGPGSNDPGN